MENNKLREELIMFYIETCNLTINRKFAEDIVDEYIEEYL